MIDPIAQRHQKKAQTPQPDKLRCTYEWQDKTDPDHKHKCRRLHKHIGRHLCRCQK